MIENQKKIVKESFRRLAILIGLEIKQGWIDALAPKIGIKRSGIYNWISRGRIAGLLVDNIEKLGYDREEWLIPEAIAWYERKYAETAKGIRHQTIAEIYGRLRAAFEGLGLTVPEALFKANVAPVRDRNYFLGDVPNPKKLQQVCDRLDIDKDWVWAGTGNPRVEEHKPAQGYPETPEHMDGPDNAPAGTYSAEGASTKTSIDNHGVVDILEPSLDQLLRWTKELLKGEEDAALALALKTNIMQFHQSLLDRRQLKKTAPEPEGPEDAVTGD